VAEIKAVIGEQPTFGYRRVHAILKRRALAALVFGRLRDWLRQWHKVLIAFALDVVIVKP
jgi:hypothetical protein